MVSIIHPESDCNYITFNRDLLTFDSGPVMESNVCGGMSGSKSTLMCCTLAHNATGWKPRLVSACLLLYELVKNLSKYTYGLALSFWVWLKRNKQ